MADSVNYNWQFTVSKDGDTRSSQHSNSYTPTSHLKAFSLIQTIPTSVTTLSFGAIVSAAAFAVKNIDTANYVELSMNSDGTKPFAKILFGQSVPVFQATGQSVYAKANTAPVLIITDVDGIA